MAKPAPTPNPIAIVTGASRQQGLGTAICRQLAHKGNDIFFTHWQPFDQTMPWGAETTWADTLRQEIEDNGVRCEHMALDLSDANAPEQLLDTVEEKLGTPSILINNAAHSEDDSYQTLNAEILDAHYAVNLRATALLCVAFARRFEKQSLDTGRIINMTSGQALGPMPDTLAYAATKGAISALTLSLSTQLAPLGITINAVNPGPTDTGWMNDELKDHLLPKFTMGRVGKPEDAARLIAFLTSEDAAWITGQVINSEGGFFRS